MAAGDKVTVSVYNTIQSTISPILGTGSGDSGYGQTLSSSQITAPGTSTKITSTQWQNLRKDILTCYNHQNATNGTLTDPTTATKISATIAANFQTMADGCVTNRLKLDSGYYSSATSVMINQAPNSWGPTGQNAAVGTVGFLFVSAAEARKYFNAGSELKLLPEVWTAAGGGPASPGEYAPSSKEYSWQSTVNKIGTIIFKAHSTTNTGTGGTGTSIGYHELTTTDQQIFSIDSTTYTPNYVKAYARTVTSPAGFSVVFTVKFVDTSVSSNTTVYTYGSETYGPYGVDEAINARMNLTGSVKYASGGTPNVVTVAAPAGNGGFTATNV